MATFSGKVALVTGGGRGIGRGIALALAKYGAKVAVMARSTDEIEQVASEIRAMGGTALALSGDVANSGVCVVSINPGEVDTMMQVQLRSLPREVMGEPLYNFFHSLKAEGKLTDPLRVGEQIVAIMMTDKTGETLSIYDIQDEVATILAQAKAVG